MGTKVSCWPLTFLLFICLGSLLVELWFLLESFFSYKTYLAVRHDTTNILFFPTITVCSQFGYKNEEGKKIWNPVDFPEQLLADQDTWPSFATEEVRSHIMKQD